MEALCSSEMLLTTFNYAVSQPGRHQLTIQVVYFLKNKRHLFLHQVSLTINNETNFKIVIECC